MLTALADRIGPRILRDPRPTGLGGARTRRVLRRPPTPLRPARRPAAGTRLPPRRGGGAAHASATAATASYAQVAALAGSPAAVRAVGTACATNPVPVIVPCHRVVRSDGTIGAYRGGPAAKRLLLDLEAG